MTYYFSNTIDLALFVSGQLRLLANDSQSTMTITLEKSEGYYVATVIYELSENTEQVLDQSQSSKQLPLI